LPRQEIDAEAMDEERWDRIAQHVAQIRTDSALTEQEKADLRKASQETMAEGREMLRRKHDQELL
jgi:hypothetical protein